jgi:putative addiction module CopG family antidote
MNVTLSPEIESLLREKVEGGKYGDADAVLAEALLALDYREKLEAFRGMLDKASRQIDEGEFVDWYPGIMEKWIREADEDERLGVPIRDEVIP